MTWRYTQAHLIGGPLNGSVIALDSPLPEYRMAAPPQGQRVTEPWTVHLRTGIYVRTAPLRYDPITHQPTHDPVCFVYEWTGWES